MTRVDSISGSNVGTEINKIHEVPNNIRDTCLPLTKNTDFLKSSDLKIYATDLIL
jgi:hypothetical protein